MIKKLAGLVLLSGVAFTTLAQVATTTTTKKTPRPDIPGTFNVEFGFNRDVSGPPDFSLYFWGSRTANIYYQYDIRILNSSFSVVPGIGLSLERYKFKNNYMLGYDADSELIMIPEKDAPVEGITKSMLITNYVEVPVEIRYTVNPEDPARSFKVSVGGRVGFLYDSFNKVKYRENDEVKKYKDKQDFNLNKFRYGLMGRIGFGPFGVFTYYNLSPLFEKGKGLKTDDTFNDFNTWTIGVSLSSF
ncbi:MAG TPA: hypothetical protein VK589_12000 [Chryseolinea sp.]|nr:hypothetical protein [Chryseolinea sp.]